MSQLDKTIFIADMIEPLRTRSSLDDLRLLVGTSTLDDLFMQCYSRTILYLIEKRRYVYPESIEVWNAIISETSRSSTKPSGKRREVK
jgi:HD superfamily phosphohydrolase YqeK